MQQIRILIVDDHSIVRQGIRSLLSNYPEFDVVGEAAHTQAGLAQLQLLKPDVLLLDIRMPDGSGLDMLRQLREMSLAVKVLILTSFDDDEYVSEALRRGADGYVLKSVSDDSLVEAIHTICRGERALGPQITEKVIRQAIGGRRMVHMPPADFLEEEVQMLSQVANGASNADLASHFFMSSATVKRKLRRIFDKLDVQTRTEAAAEAIRRQLINDAIE